jgi:hypothetical protein
MNGVAEGHWWVMFGVAMNTVELLGRLKIFRTRESPFEQSIFAMESMAGVMT